MVALAAAAAAIPPCLRLEMEAMEAIPPGAEVVVEHQTPGLPQATEAMVAMATSW
jgi:hypothetical protein